MPVPQLPHAQFRDFLGERDRRRLLDWVLANEARFDKAAVVDRHSDDDGGIVDPKRRIALVTRDFGDLEPELEAMFESRAEALAAAVGDRREVPHSLELEIAAHGDGAHFFPHLDIPVGQDRRTLGKGAREDRVLSAVYYFHRRPKGFSGGTLRLFGLRDSETAIDIEPEDNSLVVFPSWLLHEVTEVRCPSGRFEDYRFAVNCWFCRPAGA